MKTIVEINGANYASHGNIAINLAKLAKEEGFNVETIFSLSRTSKKHFKDGQQLFGNWIERIISERLSYITGLRDSFNIIGTLDLISKIKKINPDLIHLHVLHDNFINIGILFRYLKTLNIPIIWTFHDCWAVTGQCPYFDIVNCNKWINGCKNCPQYKNEPKSLFFDTSEIMWKRKKKLFSDLKNLTIITPSNWLKSIVEKSYFSNYDVRTIYNGINLNIFKPSAFDKEKYNIPDDKKIVLALANYWGERKGLDAIIELSKILPQNYQVVIVGTNDQTDSLLPENIISIHNTSNQQELAGIYTRADVFANPTREEVFGLVNAESLACGTPVVVFNTGGCPEIIDNTCGYVVEKNNVIEMAKRIRDICENNNLTQNDCINKSKQFDMNKTFEDYIRLYKEKTGLL